MTDDAGTWCTLSPATGSVVLTSALSIQIDYSKLKAGMQTCNMRLRFGDGSVQTVTISVVVNAPGGVSAAGSKVSGRATQADSPLAVSCNTLVVTLRQPGQGFVVPAFQPTDLEVEVKDNCGNPVDLGKPNVPSVYFISGISDPSPKLTPAGKGIYRGSWDPTNVPRNVPQTNVTLQVVASDFNYPQSASTPFITGTVTLQVKNPTLIANIVNSASYAPAGQVAPCSLVSIFGENLADAQVIATNVPLVSNLGGASTRLGGKLLPLNYVNNTQINAQIPCDLQPNTEHALQVVNKDSQSVTAQVVVAGTQPAIFTVNQAGFGQGAINGVAADGTRFLADKNHPVRAGDLVEIYCTGLGAVDQTVIEGTQSPSPAAATTQKVEVSIAGATANVVFSGLTPGAVGLYQINVVIPKDVPPGYGDLPVSVTVGGHVSQPGVTLGVDGGRTN